MYLRFGRINYLNIFKQSPCLIYAYLPAYSLFWLFFSCIGIYYNKAHAWSTPIFFFRHIFGGLFGLFSCISIYYNFQFGGNGYHRKKIGRWSSHRLSCRFQDSYIDVHLLIIKSTCRNHLTCKQISLFDARINSHIAI